MNVPLPDGRIIRNVPDGTSKADLIAKLRSTGYDVSNLGGAGASGAGASGAGASALEIPTTYNGERAPRGEYIRIVPPGSTTSMEPEPGSAPALGSAPAPPEIPTTYNGEGAPPAPPRGEYIRISGPSPAPEELRTPS